ERGRERVVDGANLDAHAGARRIRRGDLVRETVARDARRSVFDTTLPLVADLGDEHLANVAKAIGHLPVLLLGAGLRPRLRPAPPAMAGTIETASPALSSVFNPSRKRMSSSPM